MCWKKYVCVKTHEKCDPSVSWPCLEVQAVVHREIYNHISMVRKAFIQQAVGFLHWMD